MDILESVLNEPIFYSLSITLLHFLWQGTIIAFALYLFLRLLNNKHSNLRYAVSLLAMALNLIIPLITFFTVYQPQSDFNITSNIATSFAEISLLANQGLTSTQFDWRELTPLISLVWIVGVTYLSLRLLIEMIKVYQLPRKSVVQTTDKLQTMFDNIALQLGVNRAARLVISMKADVPLVVGWLRPVVLLPLSMSSGLTTAQLEMLLTHELAHIKRHDYFINFLQTLIEVILFFHPCVKWVSKQVRAEREYCCDDIAIKECGNALAYATALTDAEMLRPHNIPQLAMAASGGNLKKRIFRAVGHQSCSPRYSGQWLASLFSFSLVIGIFSAGQVAAIAHVKDNKPVAEPIIEKLTTKIEPVLTSQSDIIEQPILKTEITEPTLQIEPKITILSKEIIKDADIPLTAKPKALVKNQQNNQPLLEKITEAKSAEKQNLVEEIAEKEIINEQIISASQTQLASIKEAVVVAQQDIKTVVEPQKISTKIAPKLIRNVIPTYPSKAINRQLVSDIQVSFTVTTQGRVKEVAFEGVVHHSFRRSIKKALRKWRFEPGSIDGQKSEMRMNKRFNFTEPPKLLITSTGSRIVSS